jgi:hypothetical protein
MALWYKLLYLATAAKGSTAAASFLPTLRSRRTNYGPTHIPAQLAGLPFFLRTAKADEAKSL